jgi:hypothetical protein
MKSDTKLRILPPNLELVAWAAHHCSSGHAQRTVPPRADRSAAGTRRPE